MQITSSPAQVSGSQPRPVTAYVFGNDDVFYGNGSDVSEDDYTGVLHPGQSLRVEAATYFVTARDVGAGLPGSARLALVEEALDADEVVLAVEQQTQTLDALLLRVQQLEARA